MRSAYQDWQSFCVLQKQTIAYKISQTLIVEKGGQTNVAMQITLIRQAVNTAQNPNVFVLVLTKIPN